MIETLAQNEHFSIVIDWAKEFVRQAEKRLDNELGGEVPDELPPRMADLPEVTEECLKIFWGEVHEVIGRILSHTDPTLIDGSNLNNPIGTRYCILAVERLAALSCLLEYWVWAAHILGINVELRYDENQQNAINALLDKLEEFERDLEKVADEDPTPETRQMFHDLAEWNREHTVLEDGISVLKPDREVALALLSSDAGMMLYDEYGSELDLSAAAPTDAEYEAALGDITLGDVLGNKNKT